MGRKSLPVIDGMKECRGIHGCGEWKPLDRFPVQYQYNKRGDMVRYPATYCKQCERKRNTRLVKMRRAA